MGLCVIGPKRAFFRLAAHWAWTPDFVVEAHELSDGLAQPNGEMATVVPGGGGGRSGFAGEPRPVVEARSHPVSFPARGSSRSNPRSYSPPKNFCPRQFANLGSRLFFSSPDRRGLVIPRSSVGILRCRLWSETRSNYVSFKKIV
jgi:hypothetical protein